jgi:hypothetical protein
MERLHHVIKMAAMVVTMMQISNNNNFVGVMGCIMENPPPGIPVPGFLAGTEESCDYAQ